MFGNDFEATRCRRFRFESPSASVSFGIQPWLKFMKCECNSANNMACRTNWIGANEGLSDNLRVVDSSDFLFPYNACEYGCDKTRECKQCSSEKARHDFGVITTHESFISDPEQTFNLRCSKQCNFLGIFQHLGLIVKLQNSDV